MSHNVFANNWWRFDELDEYAPSDEEQLSEDEEETNYSATDDDDGVQ
jgi:hypothetical protein